MAGKEENRIFVGGLSWDVSERQLQRAFDRYGKILECQRDSLFVIGFGLAETYVMRKLYKEKMMKRAQEEEEEERRTNMKIHTITTASEDKTSIGCFSWLSKQQRRKNSRISDSNENEAANT